MSENSVEHSLCWSYGVMVIMALLHHSNNPLLHLLPDSQHTPIHEPVVSLEAVR